MSIRTDIDLVTKFELIDEYQFTAYAHLFNVANISLYKKLIGDDKLSRLLSIFINNHTTINILLNIDDIDLLHKAFEYYLPKNIKKKTQMTYDQQLKIVWFHHSLINDTFIHFRDKINTLKRISLLDNIREDNIEIALRLYNTYNVYFSYYGGRYLSGAHLHYLIKDMIIYDDISLLPEIESIKNLKLNIFRVNCRYTQILFKWLFTCYKQASDAELFGYRFLLHKIIVDYEFIPDEYPKQYDWYFTNILIVKFPQFINSDLVDKIFENGDIFAINYLSHFYDKLTINNINKIKYIHNVEDFIKIIRTRNLIPNIQTLRLACGKCSDLLFNYCINEYHLSPDADCVLNIINCISFDHNKKINFLKKILEYRIYFSNSFFELMVNTFLGKIAHTIKFTTYLNILINHLPQLTKNNIIYAVKSGINIDNPSDYGIECDEELYFAYYKNKFPINLNVFKDKIDIKRLILRQKWRNNDKDVFKYMKENNIKPDRYCSDTLKANKRKYFYRCINYVRTDLLISPFDYNVNKSIDYKYMMLIYDDF